MTSIFFWKGRAEILIFFKKVSYETLQMNQCKVFSIKYLKILWRYIWKEGISSGTVF